MSETIRKRLHILKMILKEKYPDIIVGFYLSKEANICIWSWSNRFHLLRIIKILNNKFISFFLLIWIQNLK